MLPVPGCDPNVNVVVLGAKILVLLGSHSRSISFLLLELPGELGVSSDHIILTLDWLFMIDAIYVTEEEVCRYEAY